MAPITKEFLTKKITDTRNLKRVLLAALSVYVARSLLRLFKTLVSWHKSKILAMRLPTAEVKDEAKNSLNFFAWMKEAMPEGEEFTESAIPKHYVDCIQKSHEKYAKDEGLICLWTYNPRYTPMPICNVFIWDIDIIREITSAKLLPKMVKGSGYKISADLFGPESIGIVSHEIWHPQRFVIERAFTTEYVRKQAPMVRRTAQELTQKLLRLHQKGAGSDGFLQMDIVGEVRKAMMDVIGRFAFSYEMGAIKDSEEGLCHDFEIALDVIQARSKNPFLYMTRNILPTEQNKKFNKSIAKISKAVLDMIDVRTSGKQKEETNDLLDILLESYIGEGVENKRTGEKIKLNRKKILGNINTILIAGHDTTAATLSWMLFLLGKHPEVKKKLVAEFEENNCDMSPDKLENYEFLSAVVLEVLRLYPSAPFMKQATEDITVGNGKYVIPKGIDIFCFPYFQQRDPNNFERPNDFLPERWLDSNDSSENIGFQARIAKVSRKQAFFPFSLGARNCVGRKLAFLELKTFILEMVSTFEITLPEKLPEDFQAIPYMGFAAAPKVIEVKLKPKVQV